MRYNQTSSGRWDASGLWDIAVQIEVDKAYAWASDLDDQELADVLDEMSIDTNAYTTYERKAVLAMAAVIIRS